MYIVYLLLTETKPRCTIFRFVSRPAQGLTPLTWQTRFEHIYLFVLNVLVLGTISDLYMRIPPYLETLSPRGTSARFKLDSI